LSDDAPLAAGFVSFLGVELVSDLEDDSVVVDAVESEVEPAVLEPAAEDSASGFTALLVASGLSAEDFFDPYPSAYQPPPFKMNEPPPLIWR
jgi:hypothetical protein